MKSKVASVLREDPVSRINFKIDTIYICKVEMEKVAKAIESDDIKVEVGSTGHQLGAAYSSWKTRRQKKGVKKILGKITVSSKDVATKPLGRAGIFHECVHALMDVNDIKISMHNDEVAAYLADALYLKLSRINQVRGGAKEVAIFKAAFDIIKAKRLTKKAGVVLQWKDCTTLLNAIKAHPAYH